MSTTILVTGGSGMVGRCLQDITINYPNKWIFLSSKDGDLTKVNIVEQLFQKHQPNLVIHLAANVGGLFKNLRERVNMFKDNIRINENILEACHKYNVQKGVFCLSTCIFPYKPSKYPMDESMIHESAPHPSNEGYGYAKRMMEMQCRNYNQHFGRQYICVVPVNLYGPYDNFNIQDSHVIPGLIHRIFECQKQNKPFVVYGSGSPLRQFIYSRDFAKIIIKILLEYENTEPIICCHDEISIDKITHLIVQAFGYNKQRICHDLTKSDGCARKTVTDQYFRSLFPDFKYTSLDSGIQETIAWFLKNYNACRK